MTAKVFHSLPEALLYGLLILVVSMNIYLLSIVVAVNRTEQTNEQLIKNGVANIEEEQSCIGAFFLQGNRTELTLNNLKICQPVVQKLQ